MRVYSENVYSCTSVIGELLLQVVCQHTLHMTGVLNASSDSPDWHILNCCYDIETDRLSAGGGVDSDYRV